jgi:hypothetical protein
MAFTRGLYYPRIDIADSAWLKSALIYWDILATIVPAGFDQPYVSAASRRFFDAGLIEPLHVASEDHEIEGLSQEVVEYLKSPEGLAVLAGRDGAEYVLVHPEKLPKQVRELVSIHPMKLPYAVREMLGTEARRGDWLSVDNRFAAFYMTLLATRLAGRFGLGLLTDDAGPDGLADVSRRGDRRTTPDWEMRMHGRFARGRSGTGDARLAQGLLANLVVNGVRIDPRTSIKRILEFRQVHAAEIGQLRLEIAKLVDSVEGRVQSLDALRQDVADVYRNSVLPSIAALQKALTGSRIKWLWDNALKVSSFSAGATSLPVVLGLSVPHALLAGIGASLTVASAQYRIDRRAALQASPYAVLLAAERELR